MGLAPLSRLPFQRSFLLWVTIGLVFSLSSLFFVIRVSGAHPIIPVPLILLLVAAYIPFSVNTLYGGQVSWFGLGILALISAFVLRGEDFRAGLTTSLTYYKPPLFLFLLLALWLGRGRRFGLGFFTGAAVLMGATFLAVGAEGMTDYLSTVSRYTYGQEVLEGTRLPPQQGMGFVGAGVALFGPMRATLLVLTAPFLFLLWFSSRWLKGQRTDERRFGLILAATASLAFSLQLIRYDLALLLVPMALAVAWLAAPFESKKALILLPFSGFYFEFVFREVALGGQSFNLSVLLFLASLTFLVWWGWSRAPAATAEDAIGDRSSK